ncbi:ABC transporter, ATP-binding protein, partial [mine drainage metagenome]
MTDIRLSEVVVDRDRFRVGPIDLEIRSGSATVLLGPSGAGKTSLLRGIAGFLPLRQGAVRVDGTAVERSPPERRGFGFVPPGLGLFPTGGYAERELSPRPAGDAGCACAGPAVDRALRVSP